MKKFLACSLFVLLLGICGCDSNKEKENQAKPDNSSDPSSAVKSLKEKKGKEIVYDCSADFTTQDGINRKLVYYLKGEDNKLSGFYYKNESNNFEKVEESIVKGWIEDGGKRFIKFMTEDGAKASSSVTENSSIEEASYESLENVEISSDVFFLQYLNITEEKDKNEIDKLKYIPMDLLISAMQSSGTIKCELE